MMGCSKTRGWIALVQPLYSWMNWIRNDVPLNLAPHANTTAMSANGSGSRSRAGSGGGRGA